MLITLFLCHDGGFGIICFKRVNVAEFLYCVDIHDLLILMIMFEEIAHNSVRLTTT